MGNNAQDNEKQPNWCIMVYMAGGKDVSEEARESLLRMKQVGSTENIHVIAQFDSGSEGTFTKRYYLSPCSNAMEIESILTTACSAASMTPDPFDDAVGIFYCQMLKAALSVNLAEEERNRLQARMPTAEMVRLLKYSPRLFKNSVLNFLLERDIRENLGETNAGDPEVLMEFVRSAKETYPATYNMLIVWGHGNGLSVAWDYPASPLGKKDSITASEFSRLSDMPEEERKKYSVNIVGFNSCSLGTIEIYRQLQGVVDYGIASEGFTPKTSWPYDKILNALKSNSQMEPREFALKIIEQYKEHYESAVLRAQELQREQRRMSARGLGMTLDTNMVQDMYGRVDLGEKPVGLGEKVVGLGSQEEARALALGIDLSLCDLNASDEVSDAMKELVKLLLRTLGDKKAAHNLFGAIVGAHALSQSYFNKDFTDLSDFCRALEEFCSIDDIKEACERVMKAVKTMSVKTEHVGDDVSNSNGVSIFFPWGAWGERDVITGYGNLKFLEATQWGVFLQKYRELAYCFERGPENFDDKIGVIAAEIRELTAKRIPTGARAVNASKKRDASSGMRGDYPMPRN